MIQHEILELIEQASLDKEISTQEQKIIIERCVEIGQDLEIVLSLIESKRSLFRGNSVLKCTACGEIIKSLDRVCSACSLVNEASINKPLDEFIHDVENTLASIKSDNNSVLINRLMNHSMVSLPVLSLISFILGWQFNSDFLALLFILFLILNQILKRKLRKNKLKDSESKELDFTFLLSEFDKKLRLIELYFGNDQRTRNHLETLRIEVEKCNAIRKTAIKNEIITYIVILVVLIFIGYLSQIILDKA